MTALDDAALVASAQTGDRAALDQLLRRHYDKIYAVCRRVTGNASDADDACQEALIKISRSLPRFDGRSAFTTWAYRIATNASLDELRKRRRRPSLHSVRGDDDSAPEVVDPLAAKRIDAVTDRVALDEALAELSDDFRTAVILRDVADFDYSEIAEVLDVPIGTVKSRIARGRSTMADRLRLDSLLHGTVPIPPRTTETPLDNQTIDDLIARDEAGLDGTPTSGSSRSAPISDDGGNRGAPRERPRDST